MVSMLKVGASEAGFLLSVTTFYIGPTLLNYVVYKLSNPGDLNLYGLVEG